MGNLIDMDDDLVFPDHEAMKEWLRRHREEPVLEELRLPLPEPERRRPEPRGPIVIEF
jgi:hypothetical protein